VYLCEAGWLLFSRPRPSLLQIQSGNLYVVPVISVFDNTFVLCLVWGKHVQVSFLLLLLCVVMDAVAGARDVDTGGALSEVPREGDTTYPGLLFGDGGISLDGDADSSVVGDVVYGGVLYDDASLTSA